MSKTLKLLNKEIKLSSSPLSFFFLAFTLMTFIPGYPILISQFFICLGLFQTFQRGREANDIIYTVLLPVPKKDVVKARYIFVLFIESIDFILITIFTLIRMIFLKDSAPYPTNALMNANLFYLGFSLLILALFNSVFVAGFFKTGYYFSKPFITFIVLSFLIVLASEILHHLPNMHFLSCRGFENLELQLIFLFSSLAIFVVLTILGQAYSQKKFCKIDL